MAAIAEAVRTGGRRPPETVDRGFWLALVAVAGIGLAARILYALAVVGDAPLVGDGLEFNGLARVLSEGRGFVSPLASAGQEATPTAHKPPLYPLVLAGVSVLGATGAAAHQVASAVIGTGAVLVIALLTRRLAGPRAALVAAVLAAAYPVFIAMDASLRSESLFVLLTALALLAAHRGWENPTPWRLAQLGGVIGLAALTRSEGLALLVLLAVPVAWRKGGGSARRLAVVGATCALVLAPWLIRCWVVFDQPVLISTSYGDLIAGANCDTTYSGPLRGEWAFNCVLGERGANEAVIARRLRARGVRYAREHAGRLPGVLAARALRPWGLYSPAGEIELHAIGEGRNETFSWAGLVAAWGFMVLALSGVIALRRRGQPVFVLVVPFVLVVLVSVTGYGSLRFRAPADVALVVLAAVALTSFIPRRHRRAAGA